MSRCAITYHGPPGGDANRCRLDVGHDGPHEYPGEQEQPLRERLARAEQQYTDCVTQYQAQTHELHERNREIAELRTQAEELKGNVRDMHGVNTVCHCHGERHYVPVCPHCKWVGEEKKALREKCRALAEKWMIRWPDPTSKDGKEEYILGQWWQCGYELLEAVGLGEEK